MSRPALSLFIGISCALVTVATAGTVVHFRIGNLQPITINGNPVANGIDEAFADSDDEIDNAALDSKQEQNTNAQLIATEKSIALFKEKLARNPNDHRSASVLARLYIRQAKETDNFDDFILAEKILRKTLSTNPGLPKVRIYLAESIMSQHRFAEAKEIAVDVVKKYPDLVGALATLADAQLNLGEYEAARQSIEKLYQSNQTPAVQVRLARVHELTGNNGRAIELIRSAYQQQVESAGLPTTESWYTWRLAKILMQNGQLDEAEPLLRKASQLNPEDADVLADLGMIAATKDDHLKAESYLKKAVAVSEKPPILALLGDLYTITNQQDEAMQVYKRTTELMEEESHHPLAGPAHQRERAVFLAEHNREIKLAVKLLKADVQTRPDTFGHDALAWAHYKNQDFDSAAAEIKKALANGIADAKVFFHAGMIASAVGNQNQAIDFLRQAMLQNEHFSLLDAKIAKDKLAELESLPQKK